MLLVVDRRLVRLLHRCGLLPRRLTHIDDLNLVFQFTFQNNASSVCFLLSFLCLLIYCIDSVVNCVISVGVSPVDRSCMLRHSILVTANFFCQFIDKLLVPVIPVLELFQILLHLFHLLVLVLIYLLHELFLHTAEHVAHHSFHLQWLLHLKLII